MGRETRCPPQRRTPSAAGTEPDDDYCGHLQEVVEVNEVRHKRLRDLTDLEVEDDGATDMDALMDQLHRFYPNLRPDDEITLVYFQM